MENTAMDTKLRIMIVLRTIQRLRGSLADALKSGIMRQPQQSALTISYRNLWKRNPSSS